MMAVYMHLLFGTFVKGDDNVCYMYLVFGTAATVDIDMYLL